MEKFSGKAIFGQVALGKIFVYTKDKQKVIRKKQKTQRQKYRRMREPRNRR